MAKPQPNPTVAPTDDDPLAGLTPDDEEALAAELRAADEEIARGETLSLEEALAAIDAHLATARAARATR
jgi:hypothetical protein